MSGELNLKYSATNKIILALILGQDRTTCWDGSAMAAINSVSDANWTAGMVALIEQVTANNTKTATYSGDFPTGINTPGEYVVEFYLGTAATPGSAAIGVQTVWWDGSQITRPLGVAETKNGLRYLEVDVARIFGTLVNHDNNGGLLPPLFDYLITRTGSTRTLVAVRTESQYITWAENQLKGCAIYIKTLSSENPRYYPAAILSNTEINNTSGTITLAGDGLPAAPISAGQQLALAVNSHAPVLDVKAKTDVMPANPAAVGSAMTLTGAYDAAKTAAQPGNAMSLQTAEREAIASALLDLANAIDGKTPRQALQIIAAVLAGKISGAGTDTEIFRGLDDQHVRVAVTADVFGNRTGVTYP